MTSGLCLQRGTGSPQQQEKLLQQPPGPAKSFDKVSESGERPLHQEVTAYIHPRQLAWHAGPCSDPKHDAHAAQHLQLVS